MINRVLLTIFLLMSMSAQSLTQTDALKVGVIGLSHTHVHWIFNSNEREEFTIVGIVEADSALAKRYTDQYNFDPNLVFNSMQELVDEVDVEAVTAFGNIYDHLKIVQFFAPLGIHVMVEKPLAVSLDHAKEMAALARAHNIHLLTNYETTWYPTNHKAYEIAQSDTIIGDLRKVIIRDGHKGPKKIGIDEEFLAWLTNPELNGGGAIIDFGCYGANLLTWLLEGKRPIAVTAVTQQLQAENNPLVDDEANIIIEYDSMVGIIQASWNWPIGRKDMEIYGTHGVVYSDNRHELRTRISTGYDSYDEEKIKLEERASPHDDPFVFMAAVIRGDLDPESHETTSLENNLIVMEILDAALRSAKERRTIFLR